MFVLYLLNYERKAYTFVHQNQLEIRFHGRRMKRKLIEFMMFLLVVCYGLSFSIVFGSYNQETSSENMNIKTALPTISNASLGSKPCNLEIKDSKSQLSQIVELFDNDLVHVVDISVSLSNTSHGKELLSDFHIQLMNSVGREILFALDNFKIFTWTLTVGVREFELRTLERQNDCDGNGKNVTELVYKIIENLVRNMSLTRNYDLRYSFEEISSGEKRKKCCQIAKTNQLDCNECRSKSFSVHLKIHYVFFIQIFIITLIHTWYRSRIATYSKYYKVSKISPFSIFLSIIGYENGRAIAFTVSCLVVYFRFVLPTDFLGFFVYIFFIVLLVIIYILLLHDCIITKNVFRDAWKACKSYEMKAMWVIILFALFCMLMPIATVPLLLGLFFNVIYFLPQLVSSSILTFYCISYWKSMEEKYLMLQQLVDETFQSTKHKRSEKEKLYDKVRKEFLPYDVNLFYLGVKISCAFTFSFAIFHMNKMLRVFELNGLVQVFVIASLSVMLHIFNMATCKTSKQLKVIWEGKLKLNVKYVVEEIVRDRKMDVMIHQEHDTTNEMTDGNDQVNEERVEPPQTEVMIHQEHETTNEMTDDNDQVNEERVELLQTEVMIHQEHDRTNEMTDDNDQVNEERVEPPQEMTEDYRRRFLEPLRRRKGRHSKHDTANKMTDDNYGVCGRFFISFRKSKRYTKRDTTNEEYIPKTKRYVEVV